MTIATDIREDGHAYAKSLMALGSAGDAYDAFWRRVYEGRAQDMNPNVVRTVLAVLEYHANAQAYEAA